MTAQYHQLTFFDMPGMPPSEASKGKIKLPQWSFSKREMLEQCPRRYYYQYFGASARLAKREPYKSELRFLKTLQNRHTRIGDLLHRAIRAHLKSLQGAAPFVPAAMRQWVLGVFDRDVAFSRSCREDLPREGGAKDPALLAEFYYQLEGREDLVTEARDRLSTAIERFGAHPSLSEFQRGALHPEALIEHRVRVEESDFLLTGKLDFAYPEEDHFAVVDWKMGDVGGSNSVLQLNSYAIAAMREFGCRPDQLSLRKISLSSDRILSTVLDDKKLLRTRARIRQDLEWMRSLESFGEAGTADAFTPCDQPLVCQMCPFRKVCPRK